jgi:hypothetical protein
MHPRSLQRVSPGGPGSHFVETAQARSHKRHVAFLPHSEFNKGVGLACRSKVFDPSPLTNAASPAQKSARRSAVGDRAPVRRRFMRNNFKPNAPALIGLAIAITLWGFGYRFSNYHFHAHSTAQAGAAKLCVEPRNAALVAASQLKAIPHHIAVAPVVPAWVQPVLSAASGIVCVRPQRVYRSAIFPSLLPLRSPPPQRFSLA